MPRKLTDCDCRRLIDACAPPLSKMRRFDWLNKMVTATEQNCICARAWYAEETEQTRVQLSNPGQRPTCIERMSGFMRCERRDSPRNAGTQSVYQRLTILSRPLTCPCHNCKKLKRPELIDVMLLQVSTRPHVAKLTGENFLELVGKFSLAFSSLLPFSSDIGPTKYRLFLAQQYFLNDKTLANVNELKTGIGDFCDSKPIKFYKGVDDLHCHWKQVIKIIIIMINIMIIEICAL